MNAREQIQKLTNAWYGFSVVGALLSFAWVGLNPIKLALAALIILPATFVSLCVDFVIGKLLLAKSSLTRGVVLVFSFVGVVLLGIVGVRALFDWSLMMALICGLNVMMLVRSIKVLRAPQVRAYFQS
ncbi:MAG: hypothetical protein U0271_22930 [Polyangiaceae bacterium]